MNADTNPNCFGVSEIFNSFYPISNMASSASPSQNRATKSRDIQNKLSSAFETLETYCDAALYNASQKKMDGVKKQFEQGLRIMTAALKSSNCKMGNLNKQQPASLKKKDTVIKDLQKQILNLQAMNNDLNMSLNSSQQAFSSYSEFLGFSDDAPFEVPLASNQSTPKDVKIPQSVDDREDDATGISSQELL